jgi:hypothetical protein
MPSDGSSGKIPGASLLQGSQAASSINTQQGGKHLPPGGKGAAVGATIPNSATIAAAAVNPAQVAVKAAVPDKAPPPPRKVADPALQVNLLNSHLNDSGRPDQFRVDPTGGKLIQQINPANGAVVGEFSAEEFPALARSIGASGLIIDSLA